MQRLLHPALVFLAALVGFFAGAWVASILGLVIDLSLAVLGRDPLGIWCFAQFIGAPLGMLLSAMWVAKRLGPIA